MAWLIWWMVALLALVNAWFLRVEVWFDRPLLLIDTWWKLILFPTYTWERSIVIIDWIGPLILHLLVLGFFHSTGWNFFRLRHLIWSHQWRIVMQFPSTNQIVLMLLIVVFNLLELYLLDISIVQDVKHILNFQFKLLEIINFKLFWVNSASNKQKKKSFISILGSYGPNVKLLRSLSFVILTSSQMISHFGSSLWSFSWRNLFYFINFVKKCVVLKPAVSVKSLPIF